MARFAAAAPPAAAASSDGRNVTLPPDSLNNEGDGRAHRLTRGSSGRKTSGAKSKKAGGTLPYSLLATFYKGATGERPPQLDAETRALINDYYRKLTKLHFPNRLKEELHAPPLAQCRGARHRERGRDLFVVGRSAAGRGPALRASATRA